jgi:hypothetical protein
LHAAQLHLIRTLHSLSVRLSMLLQILSADQNFIALAETHSYHFLGGLSDFNADVALAGEILEEFIITCCSLLTT